MRRKVRIRQRVFWVYFFFVVCEIRSKKEGADHLKRFVLLRTFLEPFLGVAVPSSCESSHVLGVWTRRTVIHGYLH